MADKKLNEVTKVTDMAYVPVIMADGSIGQIAKADLASVVAGILPQKIKFFRYVSQENNNVYSLEINVSGLGWDNGYPKKWELYGGQWNQSVVCFASGICRLYEGEYSQSLVVSKSNINPTVTINDSGILHVEFGVQLSYAKLVVYF